MIMMMITSDVFIEFFLNENSTKTSEKKFSIR